MIYNNDLYKFWNINIPPRLVILHINEYNGNIIKTKQEKNKLKQHSFCYFKKEAGAG